MNHTGALLVFAVALTIMTGGGAYDCRYVRPLVNCKAVSGAAACLSSCRQAAFISGSCVAINDPYGRYKPCPGYAVGTPICYCD
ncbi:hypothetical protein AAVH_06386 [Aphelenchoides avenae]|nr:hypothetical protein AAVH_06386 [Aphelenchus avenae]